MDREYPAYPMVGVGVVVWKDGRVLLIRRGKAPMDGRWSLPGGRQELGETVRETAVREVAEETGLDIRLGPLLDVVDSMRRDAAGRIVLQYALVDFEADWAGGAPVAGDDAVDVAWADPDALDRYGLWAETRRIIALSRDRRARAGAS
jgi:8-oxo-dGTP diphosphatase